MVKGGRGKGMSKEEGRGWNGRVENEEAERGWKLIGILRLGE